LKETTPQQGTTPAVHLVGRLIADVAHGMAREARLGRYELDGRPGPSGSPASLRRLEELAGTLTQAVEKDPVAPPDFRAIEDVLKEIRREVTESEHAAKRRIVSALETASMSLLEASRVDLELDALSAIADGVRSIETALKRSSLPSPPSE